MKKIIIILICLTALYYPMVFGQEEDPSAKTELDDGKKDKSGTQTSEKGEKVMIATVNDTMIYQVDLDQETQRLMAQYSNSISPDQLTALKPSIEKQALDTLINKTLLLQKAKMEKIAADPEAVEQTFNDIAKQFPSPEVFRQQIAMLGMTENQIKKDIRSEIKVSTLLERQTESLPESSTEEVEAFYTAQPDIFKTNERVSASHILLTSTPDESPVVKKEKRTRLEGLKTDIGNGADFADLAKQHSECPSNANGGDLGLFERGQMVKPFEDVAFTMKPGEVSDIVETQFGYHLIKVTGHEDPRPLKLEEVKDQISTHLRQQKENEIVETYVKKLRTDATIKYSEGMAPSVDSLK